MTIAVSGFDWVLWKKTLNRFHSIDSDRTLTFFVLQLYVVMMLGLSGIAVLVCRFWLGTIDDKMRTFPQSKFAVMSAFDTAATLCSSMAGAVVAGHIQTLLNQAMLPLTMLFSIIFIAASYSIGQYAGAAMILAGALVAAVPSVDATDSSGRPTQAWGIIVYSLGSLPFAASNVYREFLFRGRDELNIFYMMFWTGLYQFLMSFLSAPLLSLDIFGGTSLSEFPGQVHDGFRCLFGLPVDGFTCHEGVAPVIYLCGYVALNFCVSILRLLLIKHGSALLLQITNACALLASNLLFCVPFIMGPDTEEFNYFDAIGLSIVMAGFVVFRAALYHRTRSIARLKALEQEQEEADTISVSVSHLQPRPGDQPAPGPYLQQIPSSPSSCSITSVGASARASLSPPPPEALPSSRVGTPQPREPRDRDSLLGRVPSDQPVVFARYGGHADSET
jgi:hypothetical protein